jgi:hypothetical protein
MEKLLCGLAALPLMAGIAMAGQPVALSDAQMDKVTSGAAGFMTGPWAPIQAIVDVEGTTTLIVVSTSPQVGQVTGLIETLSYPPNGPAGPFSTEFYKAPPPPGPGSAQTPPAFLGLAAALTTP